MIILYIKEAVLNRVLALSYAVNDCEVNLQMYLSIISATNVKREIYCLCYCGEWSVPYKERTGSHFTVRTIVW
jgi:hypothetical protein